MFLIYCFLILLYHAKVHWKDIKVNKVKSWWASLIISALSPIFLFEYFVRWFVDCFVIRYYICELEVKYKNNTNGSPIRTHSRTIRRFCFQDVVNNSFIKELKKEIELKDDEYFYFSSISRVSSVAAYYCFKKIEF